VGAVLDLETTCLSCVARESWKLHAGPSAICGVEMTTNDHPLVFRSGGDYRSQKILMSHGYTLWGLLQWLRYCRRWLVLLLSDPTLKKN
jgi:hypothetical protein